jgi:RHS repeat-associated protein
VGHVTTFNTYDAHGQPTAITDANGVVTTITYDLRQRITSRTEGTESTTHEYWPTGSLKKVGLPDGTWVQYVYDAAHRLIETHDSAGNKAVYTLDDAGNRIGEERFDPSGALARTESRTYNIEGELWQSISASTSGSHVTEYTYDGAGNEISKVDPLGRLITKSYDELKRLKEVTEAGGGLIKYGYDGLDNLTSITDARNRVTTYTYNGLGDLTKIVSPDSGTGIMTYDENGNLLTRKDARNITMSYSYDATNRVATVDFGDQLLTYTYDVGANAAGRLTSIADSMQSQSWTYDAQGRVTSAIQVVGASSATTSYAYSNTVLTMLTTPSGHSIGYTYTDGRVTGISVNGTVLLSDVIRDPFGALRQWTWGNSSLMVRTYDLDGRLKQIDSGGDLRELDYDEAGRLIGNVRVGSPSLSWTYDYNDEDQLVSAQRSGATYGWTYDANGNRKTQTGVAATTSTIASTSNRMTSSTGALARTYTYDAAGNIKTFSNRVLTYNNRGRLSSVSVGGVANNYIYNAFGYRVKKAGAQTAYFVYDEMGHLLGEYDSSGALIQELVWLDDVPVATLRPNGTGGVEVFYVHADHLNTPRRVTRASNNAAMWTWDPDPFGQALPNENPAGQGIFKLNLRFSGQYYDVESGLHYNHHRDYDPATGRYLQSDPIGLTGGLNTYSYVNSRPHSATDPSGLVPTLAAHEKNSNTSCCVDGIMTICMENPENSTVKCEILQSSMLVHERSHLNEFRAQAPKICTGVVGKRSLAWTTWEEWKVSEVTAFNVQLDYINARRRSSCSSPYCEGEISHYIDWILNTAIPGVMRGTYGH